MRTGWWLPLCLLVLGSTGYIAASRRCCASGGSRQYAGSASEGATDSNDCGFSPADNTATGALRFTTGRSALQRLYMAIEQREDKRVP